MPLPLGHSAIGLATHELSSKDSTLTKWKVVLFVSVLANLPDMDVVVGLLLRENGAAFHRGPTHSLVFAVIMGWVASMAWKIWPKIPRLGFAICFLVIFSHVLSDLFFTSTPVSLLWPLEVNWSLGHSGWTDVLGTVFLKAFQDAGIVLGCIFIILGKQMIRRLPRYRRLILGFYRRHQETSARS